MSNGYGSNVGGSSPASPAGWYPDPQDGSRQRYWDGQAWTGHVHPPVAAATAPVQSAYGTQQVPGSGMQIPRDPILIGAALLAIAAAILETIAGFSGISELSVLPFKLLAPVWIAAFAGIAVVAAFAFLGTSLLPGAKRALLLAGSSISFLTYASLGTIAVLWSLLTYNITDSISIEGFEVELTVSGLLQSTMVTSALTGLCITFASGIAIVHFFEVNRRGQRSVVGPKLVTATAVAGFGTLIGAVSDLLNILEARRNVLDSVDVSGFGGTMVTAGILALVGGILGACALLVASYAFGRERTAERNVPLMTAGFLFALGSLITAIGGLVRRGAVSDLGGEVPSELILKATGDFIWLAFGIAVGIAFLMAHLRNSQNRPPGAQPNAPAGKAYLG